MPLITLKFKPQAWVKDYAIEVDPEGPDTWEVSDEEIIQKFPSRTDWETDHYERDDMRYHDNAPKWIREWSGPFEVELNDPHVKIWPEDYE